MDNIDAINFLTGSEARWDILLGLFEEERDFAALRNDLEIPQSTLNRNLAKLDDKGWVREDEDRIYRLTNLGRFFVDRLRPLEDVLTIDDILEDYPDAFPLAEFDFDVTRLAEADWQIAGPNEPYAAINAVRSLFENGTELRGYMPHYNPAYIDVSEQVASRPDGKVIGMVPSHQFEAAVADDNFDLSQFRDNSAVEFRTWDGDIDHGIAIIDDEVAAMTGHHEGGMPSIMFESRDEAVVDSIRDRWMRVYEQSIDVRDYW